MTELHASDFDAFFRELWGRPAFAWQSSLAHRVAADETGAAWPEVIALPTASGKTACIDIAVFSLAVQASRGSGSVTAPRRIFFVVDRRVIVDEAFARARWIAERLRSAKGGVLGSVAAALASLTGERSGDPLAAFELRGGIYRSEDWARSPTQPIVVCSTVDQIGSRLLFRGYGRSWKAWPIHAGLVGNDALVLLDEAHCARPFLETLQAVARYRSWAERPLHSVFRAVVMSATPPPGSSDVFRDTSDEPRDPGHPLGRRQLAKKPVRLVVAEKAKGRVATDQLAVELAKAAIALGDGPPKAIVVFCNRVATARATYLRLSRETTATSVLLTGRMRPVDKDEIVASKLDALASSRSVERNLEKTTYVVATQTLEVGADLDFDGLVTECASLDALRQRFGRLNRMGRPIDARGVVVVRADQCEDSEDDPVYGGSLSRTYAWLSSLSDEARDFGIASLTEHLEADDRLQSLNAPAQAAPIMLPAYVDAWSQTAPVPEPSPDVALFLHGPSRPSGFVQVCFRADLDLAQEEPTCETVVLAPPLSAECLSVPIALMRRFVAGDDLSDDSSDVAGAAAVDGARPDGERSPRPVVLWRARDDVRVLREPGEMRPGDTLVVSAAAAEWRQLGDVPSADHPILDRADQVFRQMRAKAMLRVHPAVLAEWPQCAATRRLLELEGASEERLADDPNELLEDVRSSLRALASETEVQWLAEIAVALADDRRTKIIPHPVRGFIVLGSRRLPSHGQAAEAFSDEDDATASGTVRVELGAHLEGVAAYARRFAEALPLDPELVQALECAGRLHDLGKADPRFQALLRSGNPWVRDALLAKSERLPRGLAAFKRARLAAGYPPGARHELLSIRLAESAPEILPSDDAMRDLVLHLVASHHGHCRPFAPVAIDSEPVSVRLEFGGRTLLAGSDTQLERLDSGVSDRYWRLVRRYGWWGLAWLEAILRLADHRRSEAEQDEVVTA